MRGHLEACCYGSSDFERKYAPAITLGPVALYGAVLFPKSPPKRSPSGMGDDDLAAQRRMRLNNAIRVRPSGG